MCSLFAQRCRRRGGSCSRGNWAWDHQSRPSPLVHARTPPPSTVLSVRHSRHCFCRDFGLSGTVEIAGTRPVLLLALPPTGSPPTCSLPTSSPSILRECYYLGSSIASHLTDQPCQRFRVVGIHQHRGKPAWFPFSALPLPHRYPFSSCLLLTPSPHPFFGSIATFSSSTASPVTGLPACNCGLPGTIEIVGNPPGFCSRHSCLLITAHPPARSAPPPSPIRFIPLYARYVLPSASLVPLLNTPAASIHPDSRRKLIR